MIALVIGFYLAQLMAARALLTVSPTTQRIERSTTGKRYINAASQRYKSETDAGYSSSTGPNARVDFVDFWGSHFRTDHDDKLALPVDPSMDRRDGPLPPGAYQIQGKPEFDPKPACRIALSIDWMQRNSRFERMPLEADEVVRQVQQCIDAGFQTFQLRQDGKKSSNNGNIGRIIQETPKFVDMHWVVRLDLPRVVTPSIVRESVFNLLAEIRSDSIDSLLVPFHPGILPQYHLEVLDVLHDMQRDGYIRSVGVEDWPESLSKQARSCGFIIDTQQQEGNLLLPPLRSLEECETADWWTNPLAHNFLSENLNFLADRTPPVHVKGWNIVQRWYTIKQQKRYGKQVTSESIKSPEMWKAFQQEVRGPLRHLAWKHEVSIAAIVLRWSLQEDITTKDQVMLASSVVYPLFLVEEPGEQVARQARDLRDVFRFQLDDEDLEILEKVMALPKAKAKTLRIDEVDVPINDIPANFLREFETMNAGKDDQQVEEDRTEDCPDIDFNNPALWL